MPVAGLAKCIVLPSWTTGYEERHRPSVAFVGSAVGRPQPVFLVHGAQDNVEGYEHQEDSAVRRHARQEQEESQSAEVARVAGQAKCPRPHHLISGADRRSLRLRGRTTILSRKEIP